MPGRSTRRSPRLAREPAAGGAPGGSNPETCQREAARRRPGAVTTCATRRQPLDGPGTLRLASGNVRMKRFIGGASCRIPTVPRPIGRCSRWRGVQVVRRGGRAAGRPPGPARRGGARAGRGERRGQVDAGEDPGRRAPPGPGHRAARRRAAAALRPGRRPGRRDRGDLPGADALPGPVGRGEHLHGPAAAAPRCAGSTGRDARAAPPSCSTGSACTSTRTGRPAACPSPTSSSSRSPRRCPSTPGCWSWTSRPRRCPGWRWSGCSRWPGRCATRGAAVLFISHRFDEVFALCQRITVMRDGQLGVHRPDRGR